MFSGECCPCGRIKGLRAEQSLVLNPEEMDVGAECAVAVTVIGTLELPLLPLWAPQAGQELRPSTQTLVCHWCATVPCWKLWGGCPSLAAPAGAPSPSPQDS